MARGFRMPKSKSSGCKVPKYRVPKNVCKVSGHIRGPRLCSGGTRLSSWGSVKSSFRGLFK